jgi:hypothetical protein
VDVFNSGTIIINGNATNVGTLVNHGDRATLIVNPGATLTNEYQISNERGGIIQVLGPILMAMPMRR